MRSLKRMSSGKAKNSDKKRQMLRDRAGQATEPREQGSGSG